MNLAMVETAELPSPTNQASFPQIWNPLKGGLKTDRELAGD